MQTKITRFIVEFWPTLLSTAACIAAVVVWTLYFSTSVQVRPMLEQPGVVPFYTTRPASPNPEFGMSVGNTLLGMDDDALQRRLDDIEYLGVDWLRLDFGWDDIQPKDAAHFSWARHDRVVRMAGQHNLKVLGILAYSPAWAGEVSCVKASLRPEIRQKCAPASNAEFARFAAAAATRYPQVAAWEIWNEPNSLGFWRQVLKDGRIVADPVAYGKLANATALAIKQKNPHAKVITGGLAHVVSTEGLEGAQTVEFLRTLLPLVDRKLIDGVGLHPYTAPALPITPEDWNAYYTLTDGPDATNIRAVLAASSWRDTPMWSTEFGATTRGVKRQAVTASSSPTTLSQYDHVSEDMQADILKKAIIGWCRKQDVGPLMLYTDSDAYLALTAGNQTGFGLRRSDGSTKPAYEVVREAIAASKASCK